MTDKSWRSAKLFIMKNYTYNVDRGYAFNSKKYVILLVSLSSMSAHLFWEEETLITLVNRFL